MASFLNGGPNSNPASEPKSLSQNVVIILESEAGFQDAYGKLEDNDLSTSNSFLQKLPLTFAHDSLCKSTNGHRIRCQQMHNV